MKRTIKTHRPAPVQQQQVNNAPAAPIQPIGQTAAMDPSFPGVQDPIGQGIPDLANYGRMIHGGP